MLLCCLKSVLWTGNESAGDDVQHCENFQFTHKSLTSLVIFVSVSVEILLKLCPIARNTYLQQTLWRVVIHRTQVVEEKWKFRVRFSLTKENRVHQTKISTKTYKDDFSPAVFRSRLGQKSSRYRMFSLLRLCFGFYGEINAKNE